MRKSLLLLSAAFSALAAPAWAQDDKSAKDNAEAAPEIIITATRRAETISNVPLAVSAVPAETFKASGATDLRALNQLAPSLLISGATTETAYSARMRGIGTVGENPGLESSVAVFVDGVYRNRSGVGLTELGEIERVEVMRGPQGTLFGRNTSAGLIHVITAGPKFTTGGHVEASYGNFNAIRIDGGITGPIAGETVAGRLEGTYSKRDGFVTDIISGRKLHNRDRYLVRGQLLFKPSNDLSIRVIGDYGHRNEECCGATFLPARNLSRDAQGNLVISPNSTATLERTLGAIINEDTYSRKVAISPGRNYGLKIDDWGGSAEINYTFGGNVNLTSITAYRDWKATSGQDGDFNNLDIFYRENRIQSFKTFSQELRLQGKAFDNRLDWLLGGYFSDEKLFLSDTLKLGRDYGRFATCLVTPSLGAFDPTAASCLTPAARPLVAVSPLFGANALAALDNIQSTSQVGANPNNYSQNDQTFALFTHNVVDLVPDKLKLTLGARYTNDRKSLNMVLNNSNTTCGTNIALLTGSTSPFAPTLRALSCPSNLVSLVNGTYNDKRTENQWSGTINLSYKPNDALLAYASYSKGYKAGGFNLDQAALVLTAPNTSQLQFSKETVDAMEVGLKYHSPKFDAAITGFHQVFSNFQLNTFNGVSFIVETVQSCKNSLGGADKNLIDGDGVCAAGDVQAGVVSDGIELEAQARPARNFYVNGAFTYTNARYRDNLVGFGGRSFPAALFQLPTRNLSNAPEVTVTGGAGWTPKIGDNGLSGLVYVDFRYQGEYNTGSDLDAEKRIGGVATVNARLGLYGADKRWGIEFWGQNIFDTQYVQIIADGPLQGGGTIRAVQQGLSASANQLFIAFPGEPRTFGATIKYKF